MPGIDEIDQDLVAAQNRLQLKLQKAKAGEGKETKEEEELEEEDKEKEYDEKYMKKHLKKYMEKNPEDVKKMGKQMGLMKAEISDSLTAAETEVENTDASSYVVDGTEHFKTMSKTLSKLADMFQESITLQKAQVAAHAELEATVNDMGIVLAKAKFSGEIVTVPPVKGATMADSNNASLNGSDEISNKILQKASVIGGMQGIRRKVEAKAYPMNGEVDADASLILMKLEENSGNLRALTPYQRNYLNDILEGK